MTIRELGERLRAVDLGDRLRLRRSGRRRSDLGARVRRCVGGVEALPEAGAASRAGAAAAGRGRGGRRSRQGRDARAAAAGRRVSAEGEALKARVIAEDLLSRDPRSLSERKRLHRALVALGEDDPDAIITELLSDQLGLGDDLTPVDDTEDDEAAQAEDAAASEDDEASEANRPRVPAYGAERSGAIGVRGRPEERREDRRSARIRTRGRTTHAQAGCHGRRCGTRVSDGRRHRRVAEAMALMATAVAREGDAYGQRSWRRSARRLKKRSLMADGADAEVVREREGEPDDGGRCPVPDAEAAAASIATDHFEPRRASPPMCPTPDTFAAPDTFDAIAPFGARRAAALGGAVPAGRRRSRHAGFSAGSRPRRPRRALWQTCSARRSRPCGRRPKATAACLRARAGGLPAEPVPICPRRRALAPSHGPDLLPAGEPPAPNHVSPDVPMRRVRVQVCPVEPPAARRPTRPRRRPREARPRRMTTGSAMRRLI